MTRCYCGHVHRTYPPKPADSMLTRGDLMQPARLVHLTARRPDVADLPLLGAVVAAAIRWSA